jgi:hypothetical protein
MFLFFVLAYCAVTMLFLRAGAGLSKFILLNELIGE